MLACAALLVACGGSSGSSGGSGGSGIPGGSGDPNNGESTTSGPAYSVPGSVALVAFNGEMSYNYDLPGDGTPIIVPINMGDGPYTFRVMQNTSGNNYVELFSVIENVNLSSETAPFLVPNMFVNYNESSAVVAKARELAQGAANQGDVVRNIYQWVVDNITYDHDKAAQLASATGYVPDPDATLASGTGICFDYASLGAAMLRSLGIPCQVITGYVSPDDVYHAWNMVYIDGEWISVEISIKPNSWTRVDLTFAASGAASTIGDGTSYTDRYTY